MAYGSALVDVVQSSTAGVPPQFNDGNGTQTGTLCRAWVSYKGTATRVINASFNVSSVTFNSTGNYTINFTTALTDANYAPTFGFNNQTSNIGSNLKISSLGTTALTIEKFENGVNTDCAYVCVSIFR